MGDDAVDAGVGGDVLAQGVDPVEDLDDRVQRVDAVEGIGGRVRRSPVKADLDQHAGQRLTAPLDRRTGRFGSSGVGAQCGVDAREHSGLGHDHLAADRFFGRRAEDVDPAPTSQMRQRRGEPQTGADTGDGDQIVTATVTQSRQGVIFGQVGDARLTRARRSGECRRQPRHSTLDSESTLLQKVGAGGTRSHLFQCDLRVVMDEFRQGDQIIRGIVDGTHRRCLRGRQIDIMHRGRQQVLLFVTLSLTAARLFLHTGAPDTKHVSF